MTDYTQPDFFKFGHDSLELIQWIKGLKKTANKILDLGAGSGILGIELSNHYLPEKLTLLEIQEEYYPHLIQNISTQLKTKTAIEIAITSFKDWVPECHYDLIVCNPPYYLPGHGRSSEDQRRDIARSFRIDNWGILFEVVKKVLTPEGRAFFVIKDDKTILQHLKKHMPERFKLIEIPKRDVIFLELMRLDKN